MLWFRFSVFVRVARRNASRGPRVRVSYVFSYVNHTFIFRFCVLVRVARSDASRGLSVRVANIFYEKKIGSAFLFASRAVMLPEAQVYVCPKFPK